jgi:UDP-glucose 4-epimerase
VAWINPVFAMLTHALSANSAVQRVVILGANGFIGRRLAAALRAEGVDIATPASRDLDLAQPQAALRLAEMLRPSDAVVMLSAAAVKKGRDTAGLVRNLAIGESVCRALASAGCAHVIYLSSDSIYPFGQAPITEADLAAPTYLYATMHAARELMFRDAVKTRLAILRPTQIYGAGDTHNAYGPNRMLRSALAQGHIALFGDGEETRDHLFIDDLVRLLVQVLHRRSAGILNLATGQSISFMDLARRIARRLDRPVEFVSQPRELLTVTHRTFDVSALRKAFPDFVPTALDDGLAQMLAELDMQARAAGAAAS